MDIKEAVDNTIKVLNGSSPRIVYEVAKFEKVSYGQFKEAMLNNFDVADLRSFDILPNGMNMDVDPCVIDKYLKECYNQIVMPNRADLNSAGYDIKAPFKFTLKRGDNIFIPTGLRCKIDTNWFLMCVPKSGQGSKYKIELANTCGIIDGSYYYTDNEGHIMIKLVNSGLSMNGKPTTDELEFKKGKGFCQGIFTVYGITYDDDETNAMIDRKGGFGSTNN